MVDWGRPETGRIYKTISKEYSWSYKFGPNAENELVGSSEQQDDTTPVTSNLFERSGREEILPIMSPDTNSITDWTWL